MPKKQNLAMLEGPPLKGPAYRTLPPIGSAPPTGRRHQKDATPRKLATAPGIGHTTPRPKDVSDGSDPANRAPPTEQQYQSVRSTRQTARTEGEVTNFENVETEGDRQQPLVEGQINPDDGFFMTQVQTSKNIFACLCKARIYRRSAGVCFSWKAFLMSCHVPESNRSRAMWFQLLSFSIAESTSSYTMWYYLITLGFRP